MARLKPIGLSQEDKEEPHTRIIPDRVQKLIDLYAKNHVEYPWTQTDRQEQIFEYRRSLRHDTYKYDIISLISLNQSIVLEDLKPSILDQIIYLLFPRLTLSL